MKTAIRLIVPIVTVLSAAALEVRAQAPGPVELMRAAIADRLGANAAITIEPFGAPLSAGPFRAATPDPSAWLGRAMRFSLLSGSGPATPVSAYVKVIGDYVVATTAIGRDHVLTADDVKAVHGELRDLPLRRLPGVDTLIGARALRPIDAGTTIQSSFVIVRRLVEPGDKVTAVAMAGAVEISATLVAAEGGSVGDVIRMVNPDSRKYLRGRIVRPGFVEVIR